MYSTKVINPKLAHDFINVGDPYDKKTTTDSRYKKKQFQTSPSKVGQTAGYFSVFEHQPDIYQDTTNYRISQPRSQRKLGFGSFDADRRDEFHNQLAELRYRELLTKEKMFERQYADHLAAKINASVDASLAQSSDSDNASFQARVPKHLFDIGKTSTTPTCNKCSRETFYCKHRIDAENARRLGSYQTQNMRYGQTIDVEQVSKKATGKPSSIKGFYDSGHLAVGAISE